MSIRIDPETRRRMAGFGDINWAELIRDMVKERLELEEEMRRPIDRRRARTAARHMDALRSTLGTIHFDSTSEVRKWRDSRK